jgi:hypothetical protein
MAEHATRADKTVFMFSPFGVDESAPEIEVLAVFGHRSVDMACILSSSIGRQPGDGRRQFAIQQQLDSNRSRDRAFEFAEIGASFVCR